MLGEKVNEVVDTPHLNIASFATGKDSGIVNGALIEMEGTKAGDGKAVNTIVYFPTDDCTASEKKVVEAGGKILKSKFPVDAPGYCSLCIDTGGNPIGFFHWINNGNKDPLLPKGGLAASVHRDRHFPF